MEQQPEQINRYHSGKIYAIRSHQTDKFYIGSTCLPLYKRLYRHRIDKKNFENGKFNKITSFDILEYDDHYIELLEEFRCENKMQLEKREGELIRLHKNNLVNIVIVGRTKQEYYEDNKEAIIEKNKQYRQDNKEAIIEKAKEKMMCICGSELRISDKARHEKSIKHKDFITLPEERG